MIIIQKVLYLNFEQMKVISDKSKIDVLNCFELEKPLTVTEIAEKLSLPYSRVNYHVKVLEKVGLIEVVDTKIKSGIIEKHYLPTAEEFKIDKSISVFENEKDVDEYKKQVKRFYDSIFKNIGEDYKAWIQNISPDKPSDGMMTCSTIFLSDEQAVELRQRVESFFKDILDKYGDKTEGAKAYGVGSFLLMKKNQKQYQENKSETQSEED